jgi:hypothetical protein
LLKNERPAFFFGTIGLILALTSSALAFPIVTVFLQTGFVPRLPTAVLSATIMLLACLCVVCGLILDTVTRGRREMKRIAYLQVAPYSSYRGDEPSFATHRAAPIRAING